MQGFFSQQYKHVYYGGYSKPIPQVKWHEHDSARPVEARCGDLSVQLSDDDLGRLVAETCAGQQSVELTCAKFYHQPGLCMPRSVSYKDTYVLPLYHGFLLGVVKTIWTHFATIKVRWNGALKPIKSLLRLHSSRMGWLHTPGDFGRPAAAAISGDGKTLFPHWTCEDWLHFVETFSLLTFQ